MTSTSFALLAGLLVLAAVAPHGAGAAECYTSYSRDEFPNCVQLSPTYCAHWAVSGDEVTFALDVDGSPGWIGFGLSENGGMKGADIYVLSRESPGGKYTLGDYFSESYVAPVLDESQDVTLVGQPMSNGNRTLAVFRRKLFTCDPADRRIVEGAWQALIWAHSTGSEPSWPQYHGPTNRGSGGAVLLPASSTAANVSADEKVAGADGDDLKSLDIVMPNVTIPSNATTNYMCRHVEVPHDKKYHIVRYEPVVTSDLVHHLIVYQCYKPPSPVRDWYECGAMDETCSEFMFGWAPGIQAVNTPPQAGIPMGESSQDSYVYVALQVHYNNPEGLQGERDSSGMRIQYTDKLREHDMGILVLEQSNLTIPPGLPSYTAPPSVCPSQCTQNFSGPLQLIGSFYHMHQLGSKLVTQHIRDGQELPPLGRRDYYDFEFQGAQSIPPESAVLQPGDTLITTCTYDSTSRANTTKFGLATTDEMCFNFLSYYPRQTITQCSTEDITGLARCMDAATAAALDQQMLEEMRRQAARGAPAPEPEGTADAPAGEDTDMERQVHSLLAKGAMVNLTSPPEFKAYNAYATCPGGKAKNTTMDGQQVEVAKDRKGGRRLAASSLRDAGRS